MIFEEPRSVKVSLRRGRRTGKNFVGFEKGSGHEGSTEKPLGVIARGRVVCI